VQFVGGEVQIPPPHGHSGRLHVTSHHMVHGDGGVVAPVMGGGEHQAQEPRSITSSVCWGYLLLGVLIPGGVSQQVQSSRLEIVG